MSKNSTIDIFVRVRPTKKPYNGLNVDALKDSVDVHIPNEESKGYINNTLETHQYKFNGILGMEAKQDVVFDTVAKDVVDSGLEGFNGTIFAYGQTGSGKTFTMTGGAERYVDRGYDLLDASHTTNKLEDLPRVIARETEDQRLILTNLSVHKAESEEQALNLLFIGDTNRVVSDTPKNDASTRSHCIFIVQLEATKAGSNVKTVSRIHLVDLSGSERIKKTGVTGLLRQEAIGINMQLHFLERVIICLNEKAQGKDTFIPYRESMLTLILRDSLGGNCKTRMIATISGEQPDIDESLSTLNFAQRVALIKNKVKRNQTLDPALIIQQLKKENAELRAELMLLKGGQSKQQLDSEEIEECKKIVNEYIANPDPSSKIILTDMIRIHECFYHFKHLYNDMIKKFEKANQSAGTKQILSEGLGVGSSSTSKSGPTSINDPGVTTQTNDTNTLGLQEEIKRLKLLIQQRDNEIMILLNLINKNKKTGETALVPVDSGQEDKSMIISTVNSEQYKPISFQNFDKAVQNNTNTNNNGSLTDLDSKEQSTTDKSSTSKRISYSEINSPATIVHSKLRGDKIDQYTTEITSYKSQIEKLKQEHEKIKGPQNSQAPSNQGTSTQDPSSSILKEVEQVNNMLIAPLNLSNTQLMDRAQCFEIFRKSYRKNEALEENKELLREKYTRGKELGNLVNGSRSQIEKLKNQIEELRKERALQGLINNQNEIIKHPDEERLAKQIEEQKMIYKKSAEELKELKAEIERIQTLLERNRNRMQADFEKWIEVMLTQRSMLSQSTSNNVSNPSKKIAPKAKINDVSDTKSEVSYAPSITSTSTNIQKENKIVDQEVKKNLAAFYKARDNIRNSNI